MIAGLIKVLGWQPRAPKPREHEIPKKKFPGFFEIHRTSDTSMGSVALTNHAYGLYISLLSRAVFARSIKVLGWQPGPQNPREHVFPKKKNVLLLKFIGPVTPLWVL